MNPERLGGSVTIAEAREQQCLNQRNSKLQKRLKIEEEKKRKKEEEERENQKFKDQQRQKAEQQERRRKHEDDRRREQFAPDHHRLNDRFLQQMSSRNAPLGIAEPTPNTSVTPKVKMSLKEQELEHKRTNTAFLDKLERQMKTEMNICGESSSPSQSPPEPLCSGRTAGDGEPNTASDFEWALMKLMTKFPDFNKDALEDILNQCSGDYEQAYELLSL
ncbi:hypothetical protein WMY93_028490 [Mugilogobius chulae]|uniref:CUE domain-containing protein n=1 Tax=Mugilogobius chulae TaxID=88201 RepID=A0AAW0MUP8_9GOBI